MGGAGCAERRPAYGPLRQEEDWTFLADPACRADYADPAKHVALGRGASLSVGGEARSLVETVRNGGGDAGRDDAYLLQRTMLHAGIRVGPGTGERGVSGRVFVQLKSGLAPGLDRPAPPDRDALDVGQAFAEGAVAWGGAGGRWRATARAGRLELHYGAGRLVSVREGPNVRSSYDGGLIRVEAGDGPLAGWAADAFAVRPKRTRPRAFDDTDEPGAAFAGVYASGPVGGRGGPRRLRVRRPQAGPPRPGRARRRPTRRGSRSACGPGAGRGRSAATSRWPSREGGRAPGDASGSGRGSSPRRARPPSRGRGRRRSGSTPRPPPATAGRATATAGRGGRRSPRAGTSTPPSRPGRPTSWACGRRSPSAPPRASRSAWGRTRSGGRGRPTGSTRSPARRRSRRGRGRVDSWGGGRGVRSRGRRRPPRGPARPLALPAGAEPRRQRGADDVPRPTAHVRLLARKAIAVGR